MGKKGQGGCETEVSGYWYSMGMHLVLCHGPIDSIVGIEAGDEGFYTTNMQNLIDTTIERPGLFGGERKEGGISGNFIFLGGGYTQTCPDYLSDAMRLSTDPPAFRGVASIVFHGYVSANNPYIKPWHVKVRRTNCEWYPEKASIDSRDA